MDAAELPEEVLPRIEGPPDRLITSSAQSETPSRVLSSRKYQKRIAVHLVGFAGVSVALATYFLNRADVGMKAKQFEIQIHVEEAKLVLTAIPLLLCDAPLEQKTMVLETMTRSAPSHVKALKPIILQCPASGSPEFRRRIESIAQRADDEELLRAFRWALLLARQYAAASQFREAVDMYAVARNRLPASISSSVDGILLSLADSEEQQTRSTGRFKAASDLLESAFNKVSSE